MSNYIGETLDKFDLVRKEYCDKLDSYIQNKVNDIDNDIIIHIYCNDLSVIYVQYESFRFDFYYSYLPSGKLYIRGNGKTDRYDYNNKETKEKRIKAYEHVRNIIKTVLEDKN